MDRVTKGIKGLPGALLKAACRRGEGDNDDRHLPQDLRRDGEINGKEIRIVGIAKGSGMINPDMATMLSFVITDAAVEKNAL